MIMYLFIGFLMYACAAENLSAFAENSATKLHNQCKYVDSGYELCAFQNVTESSLRVDCQLRNRDWGTNVTIGFDISDIPNKHPTKRMCLFKETYLGDYICSLLVDVMYARTMTLYCFALYTSQNNYEQRQQISVFNKTDFVTNADFSNTSVEILRKDPLLDCNGRTGYMTLGWRLNVKQVTVKGSLHSISHYAPGDKLEAICAVGCYTKLPPSQDWTLRWTMDDDVIRNELVLKPNLSILSLLRNLTEEDNEKTLQCVFISKDKISGKSTNTLEKSTKLLSVSHQEEDEVADLPVIPLDKSESSSASSQVPEDLRFITTAATVGGLVALVLVIATVFFCRRRFRSSDREKNNFVAETETLEMYTELSPRGVIYADLTLPSGAAFAAPTETCQYAEIIGVVKNEMSGNIEATK